MVPLAIHKRVWTWLCVYPIDESTSKWKKLVYIIFTLVILAANLSIIPASVAFAMKFVSTDLEGSLHALFQITACTGIIFAMFSGFILRHKISTIFEQLTEIYNRSKNQF